MEVQTYGGVVDQLVAKIAEAGEHPNEVRRIVLTPAEMKEVQDSGAFTTTVSKYYGDSSTLIIDNIITDRQGDYISFYLGGVLVCRHPGDPDFVAGLTYAAGSAPAVAETGFTKTINGKKYMLAGIGNPADDFTISKNSLIELGLAVRKRGDQTNYEAGGSYDIALKPDELWTFAVTVGSLNPDVPNVCDMYDVELILDTDPSGGEANPVKWKLIFDELRKAYVWSNAASGHTVITDGTMSEGGYAVQTIQRYDFGFIKPYLQNVKYNAAGAPLGSYVLELKATPKWKGSTAVVSVEVLADISEFVEQP
jgi:hypothetical protein